MSKLRIDVWSDIACPWCWVGKRHLERAIADSEHEFEVVWHAFQLNPAASSEHDPSVDYVERLASKYQATTAQAQGMIDRMVGVGSSVGIEFRFDHAQPVNTFDAHRLLHFAKSRGKQNEVKEALFEAYMVQGKSVADRDTLVQVAADVGLDAERVGAMLGSDELAQEVREDRAQAGELGVTGVPFFVVGGRVAVSGAQPPEQLAKAFALAIKEGAGIEPGPEAGNACGPDGCEVAPANSPEL